MNLTLVLQPTLSFTQLGAALTRLGWERRPDTSVAPPIIPGEPEFTSWSRTGDNADSEAARISYTFNPVVYLRVLVFYGPRAEMRIAEVEKALPTLDSDDLPVLLHSEDPREVLLGIFAAGELRAISALELLGLLRNHRESAVARAAQKTFAELLELTLEIGAERLRQEKQQHPERSVLFSRLGDAVIRRETIRWLMRDYEKSNEHIDQVLRSALVDEDWEVRASAMLAAVRLGATAVASDLGAMTLPSHNSEGLDETERSILDTAHEIAVAQLAGKPIEETGADSNERASMRRHLWNCMMGHSVEKRDRIFVLVNALTEPREIESS